MHWMDWGGGWLMMASWWILIILAIVLLVRWTGQQGSKVAKGDSAMEILKKRYARGEIAREEFEQMKKDIQVS